MLGGWEVKPRAWRKVMTAYRRVYVFGHLRDDCRGLASAPEPYARFSSIRDYGTFLLDYIPAAPLHFSV